MNRCGKSKSKNFFSKNLQILYQIKLGTVTDNSVTKFQTNVRKNRHVYVKTDMCTLKQTYVRQNRHMFVKTDILKF